ncbi:ABC transporter ATP-binding protein [Clostridium oryzae]|uniref:Teichoic acids export ATP-binding protein TagH n=1 Tax=Clostridium oryzae TaxID=1450648 RepID=A0A1V4IZ50_9CLOT|nr:ABC transporter ATP-binding protein [Clostridium oryzae]OPJ65054.1 teichoic acids export ATP-binding protein TagH [Clostridium oryzae]
MSNKVVVKVENVSMKFRMTTEKINSLKHYFIKRLKNQIKYNEFCALQDINFEIKKGEVFGIIGLNGAGKSTLLKIIAGVLKPTTGTVTRKGTLAPLLELGAGFDEELTGRENIILNGMILGFSKEFLLEHTDEIIDFAELRKFIDSPLKNYSSGMKARLGFAIATAVNSDILIVDEALSVGDYKFRKKSEQKIKDIIASGATVIVVSHSSTQINTLCNRVLWLEGGRMKMIGETEEVSDIYMEVDKEEKAKMKAVTKAVTEAMAEAEQTPQKGKTPKKKGNKEDSNKK